MAGKRPAALGGLPAKLLHLCLLSHLKRIVNLNAKVANSALEFRMPQKKLDSSQVLCPSVDECRFRPSHRVGAIS
jgi:hypothetical protein